MNKNNRRSFRETSNADLSGIIEHCRVNRGAAADLRRRFNLRLAEEVSAQQFGRWLCPDPRRRIEPRHGAAILIKAAWREMAAERGDLAGWATP